MQICMKLAADHPICSAQWKNLVTMALRNNFAKFQPWPKASLVYSEKPFAENASKLLSFFFPVCGGGSVSLTSWNIHIVTISPRYQLCMNQVTATEHNGIHN